MAFNTSPSVASRVGLSVIGGEVSASCSCNSFNGQGDMNSFGVFSILGLRFGHQII